jgi:tetratricopeptide (TPR) repeat protein
MAEQKTAATTNPNVLQRAKGFWAANSKLIIIVGSIFIVLGGAYLGYKYLYKMPQEKEANDKIFPAEKLFAKMSQTGTYSKDSINYVLNGGNMEGTQIYGMLKVISNYGSTDAGNRANLAVGACYMQLKEFDKAIKYLKEFDGNGADQIQSKAYLLLGHAYSEKKNVDEALSYYKKAASVLSDKDAGQKVVALYNVADFQFHIGKNKEAIETLQDIKENHMEGLVKTDAQSPEPAYNIDDVDKFLARLGVTK